MSKLKIKNAKDTTTNLILYGIEIKKDHEKISSKNANHLTNKVNDSIKDILCIRSN